MASRLQKLHDDNWKGWSVALCFDISEGKQSLLQFGAALMLSGFQHVIGMTTLDELKHFAGDLQRIQGTEPWLIIVDRMLADNETLHTLFATERTLIVCHINNRYIHLMPNGGAPEVCHQSFYEFMNLVRECAYKLPIDVPR
jgi:hypothetical protein